MAGLVALAGLALTLQAAAPASAEAAAPSIGATWTTGVTAGAAKLNAEVNPNGMATGVRFEYLTAEAYAVNLAEGRDGFAGAVKAPAGSSVAIGEGAQVVEFSRQTSNLKATTAYRYRLVAANADGTTEGPIRSFITRDLAPVFSLPDGRGWEMVSPADKNGGQIDGPEASFGGGVFQAAVQGGSVTYTSGAAFATPQGAPGANQYVSSRTASGWVTESLTVPLLSGSYPSEPDSGAPYQLFSSDLSFGLLSNGKRCRGSGSGCPVANPPPPGSGAPVGYRNYYLRSSAGGFSALLTAAGISTLALGPAEFEVGLAGATESLSQIVLKSCAAITADALEAPGPGGECDPAATNLYRYASGTLSLVNLLPGDAQGTTGSELAASSGAISANGFRVYFTHGGDLFLREGAQSFAVDASVGGGGTFETASLSGAIAYFTKNGHLYRFDAASKTAIDLTPGGGVEGVLGVSPDGTRIYYLTATGLFTRAGVTTTKVAAGADPSNYPPATGAARVAADGNVLAFLSSAALTDYDNDGNAEVYVYDAVTGTLTCASCNPTGERSQGPASIPGAIANGKALQAYKPRVLSADGRRLFFDSFDSLAPQDSNGDRDVYQWEAQGTGSCAQPGGCIGLISNGRAPGGARFIDASADGADVFFITDGSLVPGDFGAVDLYDARVGGGLPVPNLPIPCIADACQPLPPEPQDPTPGTLLVRPSGNSPVSFPRGGGKKKSKKAKKNGGRGKRKGAKAKKRAGGEPR